MSMFSKTTNKLVFPSSIKIICFSSSHRAWIIMWSDISYIYRRGCVKTKTISLFISLPPLFLPGLDLALLHDIVADSIHTFVCVPGWYFLAELRWRSASKPADYFVFRFKPFVLWDLGDRGCFSAVSDLQSLWDCCSLRLWILGLLSVHSTAVARKSDNLGKKNVCCAVEQSHCCLRSINTPHLHNFYQPLHLCSQGTVRL